MILDHLIKLNEELINKYNSLNDIESLQKYLTIKKILLTPNSFLKMKIEYAYSILRDLNIKEKDIKNIYLELINL